MKISKQSMHYKFITDNDIDGVYYKSVEKNICGYTRQFFSQLLKCFAGYGIMAWLAHTVLIAPFSWFGLWQAPFESGSGYGGIVSTVGTVIICLVALFCIIEGSRYLWSEYKKRKGDSEDSTEEKVYPVFIQAVIDKHNKFCRNLEFTD